MNDYQFGDALRQRLADNLEAHDVTPITEDGLRLAAVAIAVTTNPGGHPAIILTLRPARMGSHAGQYALPGGKVDPGETAAEAARRELAEELGLDLAPDALIGQLDDFATRSGFLISPFVFWAGAAARLAPAPDEVAKVFFIPFHELDSDAIPHFTDGFEDGRPVLYSRFPAVGTTVFTPTASIIYQFREVALKGRSTRVAHYDQPRFAWK